jgi:citrate synthase
MGDGASTVGDLMATRVQTVASAATLVEAGRVMSDHNIGALVVVGEWMTPEPVTVTADVAPADALRHLDAGGFRHLPVTDGEAGLVGVVSIRDLLAVARLAPVTQPGELEAPAGLEGVIVAETELGAVRGQEGFYHYRQYSAVELAEHRTLEDVWYLLLRGQLPDKAEREAFLGEIAPLRVVPERTAELLPSIAHGTDQLLDGLRSAVSLAGAELGFRASHDASADELYGQALRISALVPSLITALYRHRQGKEPVAPDPELPYAANYLAMMAGQTPEPEHARAVEQYLIATIDHGFNASTFTARVVTSTGADLAAALTGAIGALSGPLHGGAPSRALGLLDEIASPEQAEGVVRRKVEAGERIMGFGHRVYKTQDPRSRLLGDVARRLGGPRAELATTVEQTVVDVLAELKPGRELYANVEFFTGVVFEQIGLPPELFTPTFTASRTIGWCAHVLEQAGDNRLIRPTARYVGPPAPAPVPTAD